jgi:hypothetical protein
MTIETGARAAAGKRIADSDQITDKVLAAQGIPTWEIHRQPDAVRAAALANAVDVVANWPEDRLSTDRILEVARTFEAYLVGAPEDGP